MSECMDRGQAQDGSNDLHPLVHMYMDRLTTLVGFLSRFIVQKQCQNLRLSPDVQIDEELALRLCRGILVETQVLIGPVKSDELETELMSMTKEFFNGRSVR